MANGMDEYQNYEKLSADRDFEGGEWIGEVNNIPGSPEEQRHQDVYESKISI
jgi:hypothetical protein